MKVRTVQLGDVSAVSAGQGAPQNRNAFGSQGHPFIRAGSLDALCEEGSFNSLERIDESTAKEHRLRIYATGTVVFAKSGMSATKNRIYRLSRPAYVVNHLAAVVPSEELDSIFLRYWLEHFNPTRLIQDSAYPSISQENIESVSLSLPGLSEQKRIAGFLEQADRLRRTRHYALELSDAFLSATFLQLFGDNFRRGPFDQFGSLVNITGGGTPARDRPDFFKGRIPWLTSKDMRGDYIWDTEEHITEEAIKSSATKLVPATSILVVVKSKVLMHRLPVAIAKVRMCHGQDIKSIQCSKTIHYEFARFVLKYHERRLLNIARGANTEGLTLPMLEELPVARVDYNAQRRFAAIVERHEHLRGAQREALRQADHLFQSLLDRAFSRSQASH